MSNQIVHIFRKDFRRHWWEVAVSLAMLVAYARHESSQSFAWEFNGYDYSTLSRLLPLLVPVMWAFLILRVLQAECLVGDRQFWVTRPYEWKKLLGAKLLFILIFINIPLLIVQVLLLKKAGFSPIAHVAGLFSLQWHWTLIFILPMVALATVTAGIGQSSLVILGGFLYVSALGPLTSWVPNVGVSGVESLQDSIQASVVIGASVVAVLWQYARRRTAQSRVLLLTAAAAVPLIVFATPYRTLIDRTYPPATSREQPPAHLAFDPAKPVSKDGGYPEKNNVHVRIPLLVSGITNDSVVSVAGTMVSIQAPGGRQWSPGWRGSGLSLLPNRQHAQTVIAIDKDFFEQVKSTPVKLHITFALTRLDSKETTRVVARDGPFTVPGEGRCSYTPLGSVFCLFPLKRPFVLLSASAGAMTCGPRDGETPLPAGAIGYGWIWGTGLGAAEFGLDPVKLNPLELSDWGEVKARDFRARLCPGTSVTFNSLQETQHSRSDLDIEGLRLIDYQLNDPGMGAVGYGISVR